MYLLQGQCFTLKKEDQGFAGGPGNQQMVAVPEELLCQEREGGRLL